MSRKFALVLFLASLLNGSAHSMTLQSTSLSHAHFPTALKGWSKQSVYAARRITCAVMRFVDPADIATSSTARAHRSHIVTANERNPADFRRWGSRS